MTYDGAGPPVAALILAAGAATRMGKLKQLLPYQGKPLVLAAIALARASGFSPVVVVVGAEADAVRAAVAAQPVEIVHNQEWQRGMGSSVVAGVKHLQQSEADSFAVAILLADQPLIRAEHLIEMRRLLSHGTAAVVAALYGETLGVPALFKRKLFGQLASLPPEAGARHLLRNPDVAVTAFSLPEAAVDVDTPEDFEALSH